MKICQVPKPFDETRLALFKQLGVDDVVYYDMSGMPPELEALESAKRTTERMGMSIPVVEAGPSIDEIVLGKEGRRDRSKTTREQSVAWDNWVCRSCATILCRR